MSLVPMRQVLDEAAAGGYGVGSFNVDDLSQAYAVLEAARRTESPVLIQALAGASPYPSDPAFRAALVEAAHRYDDVTVALHLDHGVSPEVCKQAIADGFTSVMMDGSLLSDRRTPSSFAENVAVTSEVVEYAHAHGVSVEGELGTIGGAEGEQSYGVDVELAEPDAAVEFARVTGIDALALGIGTAHGTAKFPKPPDGEMIRIDILSEVHARIPGTHLVMHGSSTVAPDLVDRVNRFGGALSTSWGVPISEIQAGIGYGVRKINIGTDSQLGFTGALRQALAEAPEAVDARDYLKAAQDGMSMVVEAKIRAFRIDRLPARV
jgi:fructose-bisphosphate aldolase class II